MAVFQTCNVLLSGQCPRPLLQAPLLVDQRHLSDKPNYPPGRFRGSHTRWSEAEDRKFLDLGKNKLSYSKITEHMPSRLFGAIKNRIQFLDTTHDHKHSSKKTWSTEEDNLLLKLHREGLSFAEISRHLPGRTGVAVEERFSVCTYVPIQWKQWPKEQLERIIQAKAANEYNLDRSALCLGLHRELLRRICQYYAHHHPDPHIRDK